MIKHLVEPPSDLSTLPEPPVPADLDLRHFDCMHLNTVDLLDSPIWEECSDAAITSALRLWAKSWQQVPCSSLPNDAAKIRSWAGCDGRSKRWKSVQKDALRGFYLCSDGRLYHHKVAEAASNAMSKSRAGQRGAKVRWDKVNALKNLKTGDAVASSRTSGRDDGKHDDTIYGSGYGKNMRPHMQRREGNTLPPLPPHSAGSGSLDAPPARTPIPPADDRVEVDVGGGVIFAIAANGLCEHVQSPRDAEIPTLTPAEAKALRAAALNPMKEIGPRTNADSHLAPENTSEGIGLQASPRAPRNLATNSDDDMPDIPTNLRRETKIVSRENA